MKRRGVLLPWGELLVFTLIAISESEFSLILIISCLTHELAHLIVCKVLGGKLGGIYPNCAGLLISYYPADMSYFREAVVLLAGSFANLVLGLIFLCFDVPRISVVNVAVGLLNLLPMKGLDGGEVMYLLMSYFINEYSAYKIVRIISAFLAILFWLGIVFYELRLGINISLLLLSVYILVIGLK